MSEVTPNELVEEIEYEVEDSEVVPFPIDPTLTEPGVAADAKATGDAINAIESSLRINGKAFANNSLTLYGSDITLASGESTQTVTQAIEDLSQRNADDVMYDTDELVSVKDKIDEIVLNVETAISTEEIDEIFEEIFGGDENNGES